MTADRSRVTRVSFSDEYLDWRRLRTALESDGGDPAGVVLWLSKVIENDRWRTLRDGDDKLFETFTEFVRDRSKGLNMHPDDLQRLLQVRGSTEANAMWDAELFAAVRADVARLLREDVPVARESPGRPRVNCGATTITADHPNSTGGVIARLKRDDPELADRVVAGEVTANAAAVAKGWRKPRVVLSDPEGVASQIRRHWPPAQIEMLRQALDG